MEQLTIYTAMVGELDYAEFTLPAIEAYCQRNGYTLERITDPPQDKRHPTWQKLRAAFLHDFDRHGTCLVMDADMLPLPWAAPIHKKLSDSRLSLTRIGLSKRARKRFTELEISESYWFNDSLIGIPPSMAAFVRDTYTHTRDAETIPYAEMAALCRKLERDRIPSAAVNVISGRFDCLVQKPSQLERTDLLRLHFLHFAGPDHKKLELAKAASKRFYGRLARGSA